MLFFVKISLWINDILHRILIIINFMWLLERINKIVFHKHLIDENNLEKKS